MNFQNLHFQHFMEATITLFHIMLGWALDTLPNEIQDEVEDRGFSSGALLSEYLSDDE